MPTPGLDRPITLEAARRRWRARFAGHVIADTNNALILKERGHPPRVYFPRKDVAMEYMSRSDRTSHCPRKGEATYYTVIMDGQFADHAVWSYEQPLEGMELIARRPAFYPDKVEIYEVDDAAVNPRHREEAAARSAVDDAIQHTDAGAGATQREPWAPNVEGPADDTRLR